MNEQPLLSICIPTYNRGAILEKTLDSIIADTTFQTTNSIEVIISDNCSSDNTQDICLRFTEQFPSSIFYYKTEEPIPGDINFYRVLSLAKGTLLKLNNDKCTFLPNALTTITSYIKENILEKPLLFFPNPLPFTQEKQFVCSNLNEFVNKVSFLSTWIGAFTLWKNDFDTIHNFTRYAHLHLIQNDILYRKITSGKSIIVFNEPLMEVLPAHNNYKYSPALVFGRNYTFILQEYVNNGTLDIAIYKKEKQRVLRNLIIPIYLYHIKDRAFNFFEVFKTLFPIYKNNIHFYSFLIKKKLYKLYYPFLLQCKIVLYRILKNEEKYAKYKKRLQEYVEWKKE